MLCSCCAFMQRNFPFFTVYECHTSVECVLKHIIHVLRWRSVWTQPMSEPGHVQWPPWPLHLLLPGRLHGQGLWNRWVSVLWAQLKMCSKEIRSLCYMIQIVWRYKVWSQTERCPGLNWFEWKTNKTCYKTRLMASGLMQSRGCLAKV